MKKNEYLEQELDNYKRKQKRKQTKKNRKGETQNPPPIQEQKIESILYSELLKAKPTLSLSLSLPTFPPTPHLLLSSSSPPKLPLPLSLSFSLNRVACR